LTRLSHRPSWDTQTYRSAATARNKQILRAYGAQDDTLARSETGLTARL